MVWEMDSHKHFGPFVELIMNKEMYYPTCLATCYIFCSFVINKK